MEPYAGRFSNDHPIGMKSVHRSSNDVRVSIENERMTWITFAKALQGLISGGRGKRRRVPKRGPGASSGG